MNAGNINSVFYASTYHPIQSGSIDGTDILPHDNAVYRALLCSAAGLYDPFGDPKVIGDPYCTVFVGRLSRTTDEESLQKAMSRYGRVKNLRLVRDIVTGASRGYAFVEYETEGEMLYAYEDAHHSIIDDSEVIVDYNRQQLMSGWIPRRLGGGLGGKKESGQLRFGGRERPFRAPLRPIPYDELKKLGIPPPPEGRYVSRFRIPSPPRRSSNRNRAEREYSPWRHRQDSTSRKKRSKDREDGSPRRRRSSTDRDDSSHRQSRNLEYSEDRQEPHGRQRKSSTDRVDSSHKHPRDREYSKGGDSPLRKRSKDAEERRSSRDRDGSSQQHHRHYSRDSYVHERSTSEEYHS